MPIVGKLGRKTVLLLLFLVQVGYLAFAQNSFSSETELKKTAKKNFDNDLFQEALAQYSQLLSLNPQDPNYNYRFGVCLFYTGENKDKPLRYLEFAVKQPGVDKESFYYLGLVYHYNFRFDDAIKYYQKYKAVGPAAEVAKLQVDNQIQMCRNGKTLLRNITDLQVLEKKRVSAVDFFRSYDLSNLGGQLLLKPEELQSKMDKKLEQTPVIYLGNKRDVIYYASYGSDAKNGKDIYMSTMGKDGNWGPGVNLGTVINTTFDEDFPFLHPNGKVLYFASKGHNSMGGYDIFKSTFDPVSKSWGTPVNLDFAINSPADDYLFITDSLDRTAYFSSNRGSEMGKVDVYQISTYRKPIDYTMVNGKTDVLQAGVPLHLKITVKNASSGEVIKVVTNNSTDGSYSTGLNSGTKVLMTYAADGYEALSEVVDVPSQQPLRTLNQTIKAEGNKLVLENRVEEVTDENGYLSALNLIQEKAKLDVNSNDKDILKDQANASVGTNEQSVNSIGTSASPVSHVSNDDLVKMAQDDANDIEAEAKQISEQATQAQNFADEKSKAVTALYDNAENLEKGGDAEKAKEVRSSADQQALESATANSLAKQLRDDATKKEQEAKLANEYVTELKNASVSNSKEALAQLETQRKQLEAMSTAPSGASIVSEKYKREVELKQAEVNEAIHLKETLPQDIINIDKTIEKTKATANSTKNKDLKEGLEGQVKDLQDDKTDKQAAIVANEARIPVLQKELSELQNELNVVNGVISKLNVAPVSSKSGSQHAFASTGILTQSSSPVNSGLVSSNPSEKAVSSNASVNAVVAANTPSATPSLAAHQSSVQSDLASAVSSRSTSTSTSTSTFSSSSPNNPLPNSSNSVKVATQTSSAPLPNESVAIPAGSVNASSQNATAVNAANTLTTSEAVQLNTQAEQLDGDAMQTRSLAYSKSNKEERNQLLEKANEIEKRAVAAKQKSSEAEYKVKEAVFDKQDDRLYRYESAFSGTPKDEVTVAALVAEEARNLFDQAASLRVKAAKADNYWTCQDNLDQAKDIEKQAFEKQAKAELLFLQNKPDTLHAKRVVRQQHTRERLSDLVKKGSPAVEKTKIDSASSEQTPAAIASVAPVADAHTAPIAVQPAAESKPALNNAPNKILFNANNTSLPPVSKILTAEKAKAIDHTTEKPTDKSTNKSTEKKVTQPVSSEVIKAERTEPQTPPGSSPITVEGLEVAPHAVYSASNPIPIDPPLPNGVIYKVQIGAFRKPISQDAFKGLNPLMGEKTRNGLLRYTAGLFNDYNKAIVARDQIRRMGYKDAFVVVFNNGQRSTLQSVVSKPTVKIESEQPVNIETANGSSKAQTIQPSIVPPGQVQTTDLATLPGVVYTIQIGVYSHAVSKAQLHNLDSIFTETLDNGLKRYTTGNYKSIEAASNKKAAIVNAGITDAFIIVFKDGKRFVGNEVNAKRIIKNKRQVESENTSSPSQPAAPIEAPLQQVAGVTFKVRVGNYASDVPVATAQKLLSIASKGVEVKRDEKGKTFFAVGNCKTQSEANSLMTELQAKGISVCSIVAFEGDKLIPLVEASKKVK